VLARRVLLGAGAAIVAGCGFELRRAPQLRVRSVALAGFAPRSPLAAELREAITASPGARVVDSAAAAEVVLEALGDSRQRGVAATTAVGQVRELQLRVRFEFRVRTPSGRELIAPTEIALARDMSYSETAALAKEHEEALLFRAMQSDIVAQVMRRLAAVPAQ
jgi:LPS-assembly lipoprotein